MSNLDYLGWTEMGYGPAQAVLVALSILHRKEFYRLRELHGDGNPAAEAQRRISDAFSDAECDLFEKLP